MTIKLDPAAMLPRRFAKKNQNEKVDEDENDDHHDHDHCMLIEIKSWRIKFSFSKSFILKKDILTVSERVCSACNKVPPIGPLEHWGKENSTG